MIQLQHVCKTYGEGENAHHALRNVNLTINDGDVFGIIGASGAGKSTLVRCLNLLERPTEGAILYDGRDIISSAGASLTGASAADAAGSPCAAAGVSGSAVAAVSESGTSGVTSEVAFCTSSAALLTCSSGAGRIGFSVAISIHVFEFHIYGSI